MKDNEVTVIAENGYPILERTKIVKEAIEDKLYALQREYEQDFENQLANGSKKPIRKEINTVQVKTMIFKACIDIGMVRNEVAQAITQEQLKSVYIEFLDLVEWLQEFCVFAPSKQIFCSFAGISNNNYNWLIQLGSDEQKEIMDMIDTYIIDISIEQAQTGGAKENTTKFRMKAKQIGHNIVEATAVDGIIEKAQELTPQYYDNILANVIMPKQIGADNK